MHFITFVLFLVYSCRSLHAANTCEEAFVEGDTTSGIYTLNGYDVYCQFNEDRTGYTFPSRAAVSHENFVITDHYTASELDRVLVRVFREDDATVQYDNVLGQITGQDDHLLGVFLSENPGYRGTMGNVGNLGASQYIFVGFISEANGANTNGMTAGWSSNGQDFTFTMCNTDGHSYFAFYDVYNTGTHSAIGSNYAVANQWRGSTENTPASQIIPSTDYIFTVDFHFGGCGVFETSLDWDSKATNPVNSKGAAIGLPFYMADNCDGVTCAEGEVCVDLADTYLCSSEDYCANSPCRNGGTCVNHASGYSCQCVEGYTGNRCGTNIDDCDHSLCLNGATCEDGVNSYTCSCVDIIGVESYTGTHCEITNYCGIESTPCAYATPCINLEDGYECDCTGSGFEGDDCSIPINDCPDPDPCQQGVTCQDAVNSYFCDCPNGYAGSHCEHEINECEFPPCVNGACENLPGSYYCDCEEGWQGVNCDEIYVDECETEPCWYGGTCIDAYNSYNCTCLEHYNGHSCQYAPNDVNYWTVSSSGCNCTDTPEADSCACCLDGGCQCPSSIATDQCVLCVDDAALTDDWCTNVVIVEYSTTMVPTEAASTTDNGNAGNSNSQSSKKKKDTEAWHVTHSIYLYIAGGVLALLVLLAIVLLATRKKAKSNRDEKPKEFDLEEEDEEYGGRRNRRMVGHNPHDGGMHGSYASMDSARSTGGVNMEFSNGRYMPNVA